MLKTVRLSYALRLAALLVLMAPAALVACSGGAGGCGSNCTVPAFHTPTPTPIPTPTPSPTPSPSPTPTISPLSCNQGVGGNNIVLGPALAPFAVLAGSTITNVGNTLVTFAPGAVTGGINDDLMGVSPGSAVTGFYPPGTDTDGPNAIYAAGFNPNAAVPLAAQTALTAAYIAGQNKAATATVAGDLGGLTLPAGVYHSTSTLSIASGNLTLDGGGNPQSVFIFQVGSSLTTVLNGTIGGNVALQNGASACNIYWLMGTNDGVTGSATLGGATFFGNVLSAQSITINATTFTGRALARSAAVSIPVAGGSTITNPGGS